MTVATSTVTPSSTAWTQVGVAVTSTGNLITLEVTDPTIVLTMAATLPDPSVHVGFHIEPLKPWTTPFTSGFSLYCRGSDGRVIFAQ